MFPVPGEEGILPVRCLIAAGIPAVIRGHRKSAGVAFMR